MLNMTLLDRHMRDPTLDTHMQDAGLGIVEQAARNGVSNVGDRRQKGAGHGIATQLPAALDID